MRFFAPVAVLTALLALLAAGFTAAAPAAQGRVALAEGRAVAGPHKAHKQHRYRRAHPRRAVSNAIQLTSASQPKAAAAPKPAGLLFAGEHIADFDQLQEAPGAITETSDPAGGGSSVFKMTVNDADVAPITPTENPRAQALSPALIENGDDFWLSTKFFVPGNLPSFNGWMSLVSIYGAPFSGSSPWQIEIVNDKLQWMRNGTYHWDVPWQIPLIRERWVTVLLHERFASDGFVEMWINGEPVSFFGRETRLNMKTMDSSNGSGANAAKIMQYRQAGMFESGTIYFGPLLLGTTREAVRG